MSLPPDASSSRPTTGGTDADRLGADSALLIRLCRAASLFWCAYALQSQLPFPRLWYFPVERQWLWSDAASGIVISWYGRVALGGVCFLAAMALPEPTYFVAAQRRVWTVVAVASVLYAHVTLLQ